MIDGQVTLFGMLPPDGEREEKLREICRRGSGFAGGRIRIWAMMESRLFPQYRERWMRSEFGTGGHSMQDYWFADYSSKGLNAWNAREDRRYTYTWKEMVRCVEDLLNAGDYLDRRDEATVSGIIQAADGRIPYPRPRMAYPDCAWGADDTPFLKEDDTDD